MTVRRDPPFKFVPRISSGAKPDEISLRALRDVVAGRDSSFPRSAAMTLLLRSDFPNKHRDFASLLENPEEPAEVRHLAALNLARLNTPVAVDILIKNTGGDDERVLAGVLKGLGRVGGLSALEAVAAVKDRATGLAASQAAFGAALISHRLGLPGHELPIPDEGDYVKLPDSDVRPVLITRADDARAEFCLRSVGGQPFGIEFAEQPAYEVRCGRKALMILFNRDFALPDAAEKLRERKAFPAVIASRSEENELYSVSSLLLTAPAKRPDAFDILIHRPNGDIIFGGWARVEGARAAFSIRAVSRPGAAGVQVEGTFDGGGLELTTALSSSLVQVPKRQPVKAERAPAR